MNVLDLGCGSCPSRWIPYADLCNHNFDYKEGVPPLDVVAYSSTKGIPTGKYHQVWMRHAMVFNDFKDLIPELCRITTNNALIIIQDGFADYLHLQNRDIHGLLCKIHKHTPKEWKLRLVDDPFQEIPISSTIGLTIQLMFIKELNQPLSATPGSDREMAYWKLRRAIANNETCPCCGSSVTRPNTWRGCDCGSSTMDVQSHADCSIKRLHSLTNGCGLWQDLMAVIVQRFEPISDDLAYSHSECEFIGGSFTDITGGIPT